LNDPIHIIKKHFNGQWDYAIQALTGFDGNPTHCPRHGGKSGRAFYGKKGKYSETGMTFCNTCGCQSDGISTIAFITNNSLSQVIKDLMSLMGGNPIQHRQTDKKPVRNNDYIVFKKAMDGLYSLVGKTQTLPSTVSYFANRGIKQLANCYYRDIRFAESIEHYEGTTKLVNHAIVCLIRNSEGKIRTMQRIFLDESLGHKAPCESPKKIMPAPRERWMSGSAVWLKPKYKKRPNELHVCEGVETGLSIVSQSGAYIEMACTLSATNLAVFEIPSNIKKLVIWADHDAKISTGENEVQAGLDKAKILKTRAEDLGIEVTIHLPSKIGDWNDWQDECASIFSANQYG
jgi:putative DNA primase/helicase